METFSLMLQETALEKKNTKTFKKMDIGDIVGLEGEVFKTKTGEISIHASACKTVI